MAKYKIWICDLSIIHLQLLFARPVLTMIDRHQYNNR